MPSKQNSELTKSDESGLDFENIHLVNILQTQGRFWRERREFEGKVKKYFEMTIAAEKAFDGEIEYILVQNTGKMTWTDAESDENILELECVLDTMFKTEKRIRNTDYSAAEEFSLLETWPYVRQFMLTSANDVGFGGLDLPVNPPPFGMVQFGHPEKRAKSKAKSAKPPKKAGKAKSAKPPKKAAKKTARKR